MMLPRVEELYSYLCLPYSDSHHSHEQLYAILSTKL